MKNIWRFLDTGENKGAWNMAVDEAILNIHPWPTLRVFSWNPAALSIGNRQELKEINLGKCKDLGIDVVRRPTGAKAVLHKDDLTYSIVISAKEEWLPQDSLLASYGVLNRGLIEAFRHLDLEVSLEFSALPRFTAACFASIGQSDLTFNGKKLAGSVQMRKKEFLLQHGSIPIKRNDEILFEILNFPSPQAKDQAKLYFAAKVVLLKELRANITPEDLKKALRIGFERAFDVEFFDGRLTDEELKEAERLITKYQTLERS